MSKAATKDSLSALHGALAREMEKILKEGVVAMKDGEVVKLTPGASHMNVIRQFLKDNGVDNTLTNDPNLQALDQAVTNQLPFTESDEFGPIH